MSRYVCDSRPGSVIVGSHVQKTTEQLNELLRMPGISAIKVDVKRIDRDREDLL